jgi:hypothetical protein
MKPELTAVPWSTSKSMALSTVRPICLRRLVAPSTDCVEMRDRRQNATHRHYEHRELDFNARLKQQPVEQNRLFGYVRACLIWSR